MMCRIITIIIMTYSFIKLIVETIKSLLAEITDTRIRYRKIHPTNGFYVLDRIVRDVTLSINALNEDNEIIYTEEVNFDYKYSVDIDGNIEVIDLQNNQRWIEGKIQIHYRYCNEEPKIYEIKKYNYTRVKNADSIKK